MGHMDVGCHEGAGRYGTSAEARAHGKLPRGHDLVETMSRYSERGHHYVAELKTIMRQNKLDPIDESKLVEMEIVQLVLVN